MKRPIITKKEIEQGFYGKILRCGESHRYACDCVNLRIKNTIEAMLPIVEKYAENGDKRAKLFLVEF